ncbi:hypothetical protein [uncultured Clostridium sp.]|nr:hypothetical protein [uncultured Clostridium sp.]
MLQATSELNVQIPQTPINFFPIQGMNGVETVGVQGWLEVDEKLYEHFKN